MDYPIGIHIETTGRCNSRCLFCPHNHSPRRNMWMQPQLFDKILLEASQIPNKITISPFKLGEPLLDPRFSARLIQIEQQVPLATIELHTNLNYLPKDFIPALKRLQHIRHIWISLNQYTKKSYKDTTGLNLDITLSNIHTLLEANLSQKIIIGRVANETSEDTDWLDWVARVFPNAQRLIIKRGDWCKNVEGVKRLDKPPIGCIRTHELSICCDGKVSLCCMDGLCEYPLGDVTKQHILDVFNSPKAVEMRKMTNRVFEPCSSCTFY